MSRLGEKAVKSSEKLELWYLSAFNVVSKISGQTTLAVSFVCETGYSWSYSVLLSLSVTLVPCEKVTFELMFSEPSLWALNFLYFSSLNQFQVFWFLSFSMFLGWRDKLEKLSTHPYYQNLLLTSYTMIATITKASVSYSICWYLSSFCLCWIGEKYKFSALSVTALQKTWKMSLESHRLVPNPD